jgi:hypothetical protein
MASSEVCENEYDKAFEVVVGGSITPSIASSAPSTRWHRFARIATAGSWGTALKLTEKSSAASTARARPAKGN